MSEFIYILSHFVDVLLAVLYFAIFIRVILSWLPLDEDGSFVSFVYLVTDPIILPIRALLDRMGLFENSPLDFSTLIAMVLVMLVQTLIGGFN
ncbi:MAG: YggT family protein [Clostridia bacterium]|nr:YggT family protein [Clostridia bacterium]